MTSRGRLVAVVLLLGTVLAGVAAGSGAGASKRGARVASAIFPVVNCVGYDGPDTLVAWWGYQNSNAVTITFPPDPQNNFIVPGASFDQGQPGTFLPGDHNYVFSTTFDSRTAPQQVWVLQGLTAFADATSPRCAPGFRGPWDNTLNYVPNDAVTTAGTLWLATQPNQNAAPSTTSPDWRAAVSSGSQRIVGTPVTHTVAADVPVTATASCPAGTTINGGGAHATTDYGVSIVTDGYPSDNSTWTATAIRVGTAPINKSPHLTLTAYALCTVASTSP